MEEHRFLPMACSEPKLLADLVFDILIAQQHLKGVPTCELHEKRMVLLGKLGRHRQQTKDVKTMQAQLESTKNGFDVASGIFRCPVPGCYRVGAFRSAEEFEPRRPGYGTFRLHGTQEEAH